MTIEDKGNQNANIYLFYHKSYSNFSMERETSRFSVDVKPDALLVYEVEWAKNRVYTTYSLAGLVFIKVDEA